MSEAMLDGSLAEIAAGLPCGFHDAELNSLQVDREHGIAVVVGEAWVPDGDATETYRPFRLVMSGLRMFDLPDVPECQAAGKKFECSLPDAPSFDGKAGWPPGREPSMPEHHPDVPVYSWFVFSWNEFITIQTERAELVWLGPATERK